MGLTDRFRSRLENDLEIDELLRDWLAPFPDSKAVATTMQDTQINSDIDPNDNKSTKDNDSDDHHNNNPSNGKEEEEEEESDF